MNFILANVIINIKVLLKDKIALMWSVFIPLVFFLIGREKVHSEVYMTFWYTYIVISGYMYGLVLFAIDEREWGNLKLMFSISNNPFGYFLANLFTQMIFSFIGISILNVVVCILSGFNIFILTIYSILVILACIPLAFFIYNLTLIKKIYPNTIRTVISIYMFACILTMSSDNAVLLCMNLFFLMPAFFIKFNLYILAIYIIVSVILILTSLYSIFNFEPIENERR